MNATLSSTQLRQKEVEYIGNMVDVVVLAKLAMVTMDILQIVLALARFTFKHSSCLLVACKTFSILQNVTVGFTVGLIYMYNEKVY